MIQRVGGLMVADAKWGISNDIDRYNFLVKRDHSEAIFLRIELSKRFIGFGMDVYDGPMLFKKYPNEQVGGYLDGFPARKSL